MSNVIKHLIIYICAIINLFVIILLIDAILDGNRNYQTFLLIILNVVLLFYNVYLNLIKIKPCLPRTNYFPVFMTNFSTYMLAAMWLDKIENYAVINYLNFMFFLGFIPVMSIIGQEDRLE